MDKRHQWIAAIVAILVVVAMSVVVYVQYALAPESSGSEVWSSTRNRGVENPDRPSVPKGPIPTDDIVKGIREDILAEDDPIMADAESERQAAEEEASALSEYENAYDENNF
jgi:hypothetical protein